jgi:hypothetical protein
MAKFILGGIVTNIAGSVGGTTLRRVPNGFSMYNKIKGTGYSRLLQNARIPQIGNIFQRWSLLSDSERSAWDLTATLFTFPDKFGTPKNITGRQLFTKSNIQSLPANYVVSNPAGFTKDTIPFVLNNLDISMSASTWVLDIEATGGGDAYMFSLELSQKKILQPTYKSREVLKSDFLIDGTNSIDVKGEILNKFPYITTNMYFIGYVQVINSYGMVSVYQIATGQVTS